MLVVNESHCFKTHETSISPNSYVFSQKSCVTILVKKLWDTIGDFLLLDLQNYMGIMRFFFQGCEKLQNQLLATLYIFSFDLKQWDSEAPSCRCTVYFGSQSMQVPCPDRVYQATTQQWILWGSSHEKGNSAMSSSQHQSGTWPLVFRAANNEQSCFKLHSSA